MTSLHPDFQLVLRLGYNGAAYSGFAEQTHARTVAGELHRALDTILGRSTELVCAGRTDAGVHATGQVVSVPITAEERVRFSARKMQAGLQALVPDDIAIKEVLAASASFSARFDALDRSYVYRIAQGSKPVLTASFATWEKQPLNVAAMKKAAHYLKGTHDFKSFCKSASALDKNTVRHVKHLSLSSEKLLGDELLAIHITGDAFLHNMVRIMVGSLVQVGVGSREPSWMHEVLLAKDRRLAGPTYPATGLVFEKVRYKRGVLEPF